MGKRKRNRKKAKTLSAKQSKKNNGHTLSVCLITKNEAEKIETAIRSVLPFADEVVVVDTGSTDDTVEIAKRLGAKIGYFEWCDDFSAARNASLDMATGDWIMWLDADDIIPASEWSKLRELKKTSLDSAFLFKLKNKGTTASVFWQMRMFPNRPEVRFRYPVHEQVSLSIMELGLPIKSVDITVVHTGYTSPEITQKKTVRNSELLRKYLEKHPEDSFCRLYLGRTYLSQGRLEMAARELERAVSDKNLENHQKATFVIALINLGKTYLGLGKTQEAVKVLEKAYGMDSHNANTVVPLAESYNNSDEPEKALDLLNQLEEVHYQPSMNPADPQFLRYMAEFQKAVALAKLSRIEEALYACRRAQRLCSKFDDAANLARLLLSKLRKSPEDIHILERIAKSDMACGDDLYEYGNALVRHGRTGEALKFYEKALKYDSSHEGATRALGLIYRREGRVERSRSLLQKGLDLNPDSDNLICDLADLYFDQEDWQGILNLPYCETALPTRLAARLISGLDDGMEQDIVALFRSLGGDIKDLDAIGITAIWNLAQKLEDPQRFHLAVSCFWIEPSLAGAAEAAVEGYLSRGKTDKAVQVAEKYITHVSGDPLGLRLVSRCYEQLGATDKFTKSQRTTSLGQLKPVLSNSDLKNS
ncbi:MAG: glycosyltransferase [Deltaproteobacteria bacterium]|nr:glycosyltransferase [Deltaproteobacteria bacterium]MBW1929225.1 glycosyltransferase [Deltaproteobacteria bacterium]MBW2025246.1 glycosyltransferase [Deltaproteobacteria bacterium]MBW2126402.1 glycosyltransferase [Deltaproteobacteria bacterium]